MAAAGGLSLSLVLFLTNSWHTYPYFLGSDIVFVFAWLPFVLAGAAGQPAVDHVLGRWAADGPPWSRAGARASIAGAGRASPGARITRRGVLAQALGLTGLGALAIGGVAALPKGSYRGGAPRLAGGGTAAGARSPGPTPATATSKPPQALRRPAWRGGARPVEPAALPGRPRPTPTPSRGSRTS